MKRLLIAGAVMLVATMAFAGGNPNVVGYIDFDPPNRVHEVMPAPYTTALAYICFGELDMGLAGCSFMINNVEVDCPGVFAPPSFTNVLPGDLAIGNYLTGITLASTECMTDPDVCVGYVTLFYLGGSCCIELLDHPDYPRWVLDCNDPAQIDFYQLIAHGSVGGGLCPDISPVEDATWGSIKAMYN